MSSPRKPQLSRTSTIGGAWEGEHGATAVDSHEPLKRSQSFLESLQTPKVQVDPSKLSKEERVNYDWIREAGGGDIVVSQDDIQQIDERRGLKDSRFPTYGSDDSISLLVPSHVPREDDERSIALASEASEADLEQRGKLQKQGTTIRRYGHVGDSIWATLSRKFHLPPPPPVRETLRVYALLLATYFLVFFIGDHYHNRLPPVPPLALKCSIEINSSNPCGPNQFNPTNAMEFVHILNQMGPHPYNSEAYMKNVHPWLRSQVDAIAQQAERNGREMIVIDDMETMHNLTLISSKGEGLGKGMFARSTSIMMRLIGKIGTKKRKWDRNSIFLSAHYDTRTISPSSTGAPGLGVSVLLGLMQHLIVTPLLEHDVIVLFDGAGASGTLQSGAKAFLQHPYSDDVGVFISLDGGGAEHGKPILTAVEDFRLAYLYRKVCPYKFANSRNILPFGGLGIPPGSYETYLPERSVGMEIAVGDIHLNGTELDNASRVDIRTVNILGTNLLALVTNLAKEGSKIPERDPEDGPHDMKAKAPMDDLRQQVVFHDVLGTWLLVLEGKSYIRIIALILFIMPCGLILSSAWYAKFRQNATYTQVWRTILLPFFEQVQDILLSVAAKWGKVPTGAKALGQFYRMLRSTGALVLAVLLGVLIGTIGIAIIASINPGIIFARPRWVFAYLLLSHLTFCALSTLIWEMRDFDYQRAKLEGKTFKTTEKKEDDKKKKKKKHAPDTSTEAALITPEGNVVLPPPSLVVEPGILKHAPTTIFVKGSLERDRFMHLLAAINVFWWVTMLIAIYSAIAYTSAGMWSWIWWTGFFYAGTVLDYVMLYGVQWKKWKKLSWLYLAPFCLLLPGIMYVDYSFTMIDGVVAPFAVGGLTLEALTDFGLPSTFSVGWRFSALGIPLIIAMVPWLARAGRNAWLFLASLLAMITMLIVVCSVTPYTPGRPFRVMGHQFDYYPSPAREKIEKSQRFVDIYPISPGPKELRKYLNKKMGQHFSDVKVPWKLGNVSEPDWGSIAPLHLNVDVDTKLDKKYQLKSAMIQATVHPWMKFCHVNVDYISGGFREGHWRSWPTSYVSSDELKPGCCKSWIVAGGWHFGEDGIRDLKHKEDPGEPGGAPERHKPDKGKKPKEPSDPEKKPKHPTNPNAWNFEHTIQFFDTHLTKPGSPVVMGHVGCKLDEFSKVPSLVELRQKLPSWATLTSGGTGLYDVVVDFEVYLPKDPID